jgi:transcriptional regulator with GAF, ATPase, and Fis domain
MIVIEIATFELVEFLPPGRLSCNRWVEEYVLRRVVRLGVKMASDVGEGPAEDETPGADDGYDLQDSLIALSQLATGRVGLKEVLTRVAELAVQAIPGAEGAGLTLLEKDRADTLVSTADFVTEVDAIQYGIGQGPCISAATEGHTVHSESLGADARWPTFGSKVARLNVHSALSLPLVTPDGVVGAMNIYAHRKRAFSERSVELGKLFAVPAAISVQNAQVLAQAKRLATQLQNALSSRAVIDQAIGIMMSRSGCGADEAFSRLRALSQTQHQKLNWVAQSVVDQAVRRARSRHTDSG